MAERLPKDEQVQRVGRIPRHPTPGPLRDANDLGSRDPRPGTAGFSNSYGWPIWRRADPPTGKHVPMSNEGPEHRWPKFEEN